MSIFKEKNGKYGYWIDNIREESVGANEAGTLGLINAGVGFNYPAATYDESSRCSLSALFSSGVAFKAMCSLRSGGNGKSQEKMVYIFGPDSL